MATLKGGRPAARAVRRHGIEPIFDLGVDRVNTSVRPSEPELCRRDPAHRGNGGGVDLGV
jgi:hypothetical protein